MKSRSMVLITFIILVSLISILYFFTSWFSKATGYIIGEDPDDSLAKCLTKNGARFFGSESCPECKKQKNLFGNSAFKFIDYIDCSTSSLYCSALQGVPAWKINGTIYYGTKSLYELRILADCSEA